MKQNVFIKFQVIMFILVLVGGTVMMTVRPSDKAYADPALTAPDTAKIDAFVKSMMDRLDIPGVAVGIVKGDQPVYMQGYGVAGSDQRPVTPQTPFILGSISKSFTALAIMQLVQQGKIELDDPVRRYLPQFELADKEASGQITVRQLLNQTSGLSTHDGRRAFANNTPTIDRLIEDLKNISLTEPVGSKFQYSNFNYDILGGIIKAVTGMSYADYIQKHVYDPLEMKNSFTSKTEAKKKGMASGHQSVFGFMMPTELPYNPSMLASGFLISTAEDMSNYLIAQINKGRFEGSVVASADSIAQMHKPAVPDPSGGYYGMGWQISDGAVWHNGAVQNFASDMLLDGDTGIVVLINAHDYFVRGSKFGMIVSGIRDILHHKEPSLEGADGVIRTNMIIDLAGVAAIILLGLSVYNLFRWNKRFRLSPLRITLFILCLLIFNLAVPAAVLYVLIRSAATWSVAFSFLPGIGHLAFVLSILSLCIGAVKMLLFVRSIGLNRKGRTAGKIHG